MMPEMIWPEDINEIMHNLPEDEFIAIVDVLKNHPDKLDYFNHHGPCRAAQFKWEGKTYEVYEYFKEVTNLYRNHPLPATKDFLPATKELT